MREDLRVAAESIAIALAESGRVMPGCAVAVLYAFRSGEGCEAGVGITSCSVGAPAPTVQQVIRCLREAADTLERSKVTIVPNDVKLTTKDVGDA